MKLLKHIKNIFQMKEGDQYNITFHISAEDILVFLLFITLALWIILK